MGIPGPDKGKGGKYLFLPPGYKGDVPEGYFVVKSPTYSVQFGVRGFLVESPPVARTVQDFTDDLEPAVHDLVPAVTDLRPVITQRVSRFIGVADPFLSEMSPWWGDAGRLLARDGDEGVPPGTL